MDKMNCPICNYPFDITIDIPTNDSQKGILLKLLAEDIDQADTIINADKE